jgi:membrane-bound inhibitor of C-type lysozyme
MGSVYAMLCGGEMTGKGISPTLVWSILGRSRGKKMLQAKTTIFTAILLGIMAACASPTLAQTTFQNYRCADGTEFIAGFFRPDTRAHLQIDGRAVTLTKRLALSGARYSGGGVTLKTGKAGATLKLGKRPLTACQLT